MKNTRLWTLILIFLMLAAVALPALSVNIYKSFTPKDSKDDTVSVYIHESGKTLKMTFDEYILSVMLANTDRLYSENTFLAEAVATRSGALYLKGVCREICGADADFCSCTKSSLPMTLRAAYMENHAENGDAVIKALLSALEKSDGEFLAYKNEYALALIHKESYISTESSFEVFGKEYSYLESVITPEKASPRERLILESEFFRKLSEKEPLISEIGNAGTEIIPKVNHSRTGRVDSVKILTYEISAEDFTRTFDIPSYSFEIEKVIGGFMIRSYGDGHGVGMSLEGAEKMSLDGINYREILLYYFRGCKIIT